MKRKKILSALAVVAVLVAACWTYDYYRADEAAVAAMAVSPGICAEKSGNVLAFIPSEAETGFIFYPGGKVEYTAYAPLMRALAEKGVLCVLIEMPLNLAVLDIHAADGIAQWYPQVKSWYIGGHSLGGSMAASHAAKNTDVYEGLVLLGAYSTADVSQSGMEVISIYGSEDRVMNAEKYAENIGNLPAGFEEYVIAGGCHAGFGSYGPQDGDGTPAISGEEQIAQTVRLLTAFFEE